MSLDDEFLVVNIHKYLEDNTTLGEEGLNQLFSEFSCGKNPDVERFLKFSSIDFAKKHQSITYLVFAVSDGTFVGYFTLALKTLTIKGSSVSNTVKKKISRISALDKETQSYTISAYLIAQLGKNFTDDINELFQGKILLNLAWNKIKELQHQIGGVVVFLETNNTKDLLDFYSNNGFKRFSIRQTTNKNNEPYDLMQFLKLL